MGLKDSFKSQPDAESLLNEAWETSAKNAAARFYIIGLIDALMWADKLSESQYNAAIDKYLFQQ